MNNLLSGIDHVVFDLDGTLVESHRTIHKATLEAFKELGIKGDLPEVEFYKMIGFHFEDIFNAFNVEVPYFDKFINVYKSLYFDFIDQSTLYDGVEATLSKLKEKNFTVSLLTTKGQDQADKIVEHFHLEKYFDYIMGRRNGVAHKPSPEPLLLICEKLKIRPAKTVMVGDSELDIICGREAGSKTCGVSYGYRSREVLEKEKPDFILDALMEITGNPRR